MAGVAGDDVDEEVGAPGDVMDGDDLGQRDDVRAERIDLDARVLSQLDGHHRFELDAERARIDLGPGPAHHARGAEPPHPLEARRLGEPDARGQLLVRAPNILLQGGHQGAVDAVEPRRRGVVPQNIRFSGHGKQSIRNGMGETTFDPVRALAAAKHTFGEHGGVNLSIEASTTFTVLSADTMPALFAGQRTADRDGCYLYGRHFNPTVYALGRELAAMEGTEGGYCCASGIAAIAAAIMQLCDHGDHVVASRAVYGGSHALLGELLPAKAGVTTTFVAITDLAAVEAAFTPRTRVLFTETLSNPTLEVADIAALAAIAHRHGAVLVVDNTFCPMMISPARLGADVVVHSLTKFINGASDLIAGAILGREAFIHRLMDLHTGTLMLLGPTMDPRAAFEVSMRLPHLALRIAEHSRRALTFATRMAELGVAVTYPGLVTHPQYGLMRRQLNPGHGFGGLLTIDLGERARADRFLDELQRKHRFGFIAVSLGYAETLMTTSASSTSSELSDDELRAAGIGPGLVRMSVGITGDLEERWAALRAALATVNAA